MICRLIKYQIRNTNNKFETINNNKQTNKKNKFWNKQTNKIFNDFLHSFYHQQDLYNIQPSTNCAKGAFYPDLNHQA